MGAVSRRLISAAAVILERFYETPAVGIVEASSQGYASRTYIVTFLDDSNIVLQFRLKDRPLIEDYISQARKQLGELVPTARLLTTHESLADSKPLFVYELSHIPGIPLGRFGNLSSNIAFMPTVGESVGRLLASCCLTDSTVKDDPSVIALVMEQLRNCAQVEDPLFLPHVPTFNSLLEEVTRGGLDDLPFAMTNNDINNTNILIGANGSVTGLVDWEDLSVRPLGHYLYAMHMVCGAGFGDHYTLRENHAEIEHHFWTGFMSIVPDRVRQPSMRPALQLAMRVGVAIMWTGSAMHASRIGAELAYTIPWPEKLLG